MQVYTNEKNVTHLWRTQRRERKRRCRTRARAEREVVIHTVRYSVCRFARGRRAVAWPQFAPMHTIPGSAAAPATHPQTSVRLQGACCGVCITHALQGVCRACVAGRTLKRKH